MAQVEVKCAWPPCPRRFPDLNGRLYCKPVCKRRMKRKARKAREPEHIQERKRALLGRSCTDCLIQDDEVNLWGTLKTFCGACQKTMERRGACKCGVLLRRLPGQGITYCKVCDAKKLRALGYAPTVLLHPSKDRERIIWRIAWDEESPEGICNGPRCKKVTGWDMWIGMLRRRIYCGWDCMKARNRRRRSCKQTALPEVVTATEEQWRKWR